jgi:hypothetical protein
MRPLDVYFKCRHCQGNILVVQDGGADCVVAMRAAKNFILPRYKKEEKI